MCIFDYYLIKMQFDTTYAYVRLYWSKIHFWMLSNGRLYFNNLIQCISTLFGIWHAQPQFFDEVHLNLTKVSVAHLFSKSWGICGEKTQTLTPCLSQISLNNPLIGLIETALSKELFDQVQTAVKTTFFFCVYFLRC